jgi:hypothetical protein
MTGVERKRRKRDGTLRRHNRGGKQEGERGRESVCVELTTAQMRVSKEKREYMVHPMVHLLSFVRKLTYPYVPDFPCSGAIWLHSFATNFHTHTHKGSRTPFRTKKKIFADMV